MRSPAPRLILVMFSPRGTLTGFHTLAADARLESRGHKRAGDNRRSARFAKRHATREVISDFRLRALSFTHASCRRAFMRCAS